MNKICVLCKTKFETDLLDNICPKCAKKILEMSKKYVYLPCGHIDDGIRPHICRTWKGTLSKKVKD